MGCPSNSYNLLLVPSQFDPQISTHTVPRGAHRCKEDVLSWLMFCSDCSWWASELWMAKQTSVHSDLCIPLLMGEHWLQGQGGCEWWQDRRGHWPPLLVPAVLPVLPPSGSGCARTLPAPIHGDGLLGHPTLYPGVMFDQWLSSTGGVLQCFGVDSNCVEITKTSSEIHVTRH